MIIAGAVGGNMQIIVLKFGSSVLRSESDLPTAVHEIYRWWREGFQVVAVVSAFGNTTPLPQKSDSIVGSGQYRPR
jgi:aspartokinase